MGNAQQSMNTLTVNLTTANHQRSITTLKYQRSKESKLLTNSLRFSVVKMPNNTTAFSHIGINGREALHCQPSKPTDSQANKDNRRSGIDVESVQAIVYPPNAAALASAEKAGKALHHPACASPPALAPASAPAPAPAPAPALSVCLLSKWLQFYKAGYWFVFIGCLLAARILPAATLANCPNSCQCDDDTLVVTCGEGTLDVLPIALNPSIQRLAIKNNKIRTIDSPILFYAELTYLDLSYNDLVTIHHRTFAYQRKLQELHLNHNKIGQISNRTFIGLGSLTILNLRGNLLAELEEATFVGLANLQELNLGQNRISLIHDRAFAGLANLRVLYLDDNTLTVVPASENFRSMNNLAELYLGTNSFTTIPEAAFVDLKYLTRLDLRGAGLQNISAEAMKGLEGLRSLDLSDNRFQYVPQAALANLHRLEDLSLGQNDFEIIPGNALKGSNNLRRLFITGVQYLKRVESEAFSSNANLELINLSSNRMLSIIEANAFAGLPHLRSIILKENQINTLDEGLFLWRDLHTLDLSDNPLICDCRLQWLRSLLLAKNGTNEEIVGVICLAPPNLKGMPLHTVTPAMLGCAHADAKQQFFLGILLVVTAATITIIALIIYTCRKKIRELLKGGWGNSALGRKEREYQKTFSDEEYMTRQPNIPCASSGTAPYATSSSGYGQHALQYMGSRPIPVTEL